MMVETRATHLDLGIRLQTEPLGNGATTTSQSSALFSSKNDYAPVLARRLGEDALRAERLLGRLLHTVSTCGRINWQHFGAPWLRARCARR